MEYTTIHVRFDGQVERATLNRPDVRNAFNPQLLAELEDWARGLHRRSDVRAAVLAGAGSVFSAGADLAWMAETATYTHERNLEDALRMAALFEALDTVPVPLVGQVHGAALGGGAGLVAVCDIVVAERHTVFGFTEVRLGLVPAVISPYVLAKIGRSAARELFLTGARFSAERAREIGLVHAVVATSEVEATVKAYLEDLTAAGPEAAAAAKRMIRDVWAAPRDHGAEMTARVIAERRVSEEGREGIAAFLEKRAPQWSK